MNPQKKKFLDLLYKDASAVGLEFQIDPKILLTQAAHETGWLSRCKGNNLYGIKAGKSWKGETIDVPTHEVANGISVPRVLSFRKYGCFRDSMIDYCKLVSQAKRYKTAWEHRELPVQYFTELQVASYATDPMYSVKLNARYESLCSAIQEYRDEGNAQ